MVAEAVKAANKENKRVFEEDFWWVSVATWNLGLEVEKLSFCKFESNRYLRGWVSFPELDARSEYFVTVRIIVKNENFKNACNTMMRV